MKHFLVEHFDGTKVVHLDGCFQSGDVAFCGHDLMGDSTMGWEQAKETKEKVTCAACKQMVSFAKKVKSTEFK